MCRYDSSGYCFAGIVGAFFVLLIGFFLPFPVGAQSDDDLPPAQTVKLIFIHHSCGRNLLQDENGGLGRALADNNYFVSDTNYGWGPNNIGDRTDITDWPEWFVSPESEDYLTALYNESGQNSRYTRYLSDPGGENQIIMFKSCFPNSRLKGSPDDPPIRGEGLSVGNAKAIYNELLTYFSTQPDKLFIVLTAPPVQDDRYAANARAFNSWLVLEWLQGYEGGNVAVFDFYNMLTDPDNHHRFVDGRIEYITDQGGGVLYYDSDGDNHPSVAGNRKATEEFTPLLNVYYHRWQAGGLSVLPVLIEEETTAETAVTQTTISSPTAVPTVAQLTAVQSDTEPEALPVIEPEPSPSIEEPDNTIQTDSPKSVPEQTGNGRSGLCPGSVALGLTAVIALAWGHHKENKGSWVRKIDNRSSIIVNNKHNNE